MKVKNLGSDRIFFMRQLFTTVPFIGVWLIAVSQLDRLLNVYEPPYVKAKELVIIPLFVLAGLMIVCFSPLERNDSMVKRGFANSLILVALVITARIANVGIDTTVLIALTFMDIGSAITLRMVPEKVYTLPSEDVEVEEQKP